jgi:hypothetical protein
VEAVVHVTAPEDGDELHASRQPPLASLSFAEIHTALGKVHAVSIVFWVVRSPSPWPEGRLGLKGRAESFRF